MSGVVSEVLRSIAGVELEISEFDGLAVPGVMSSGSDVDDVAADVIRPGEGAGSETLPGTNFFLQSRQRFPRSLSSSSVSVVTTLVS